MNRETTVVKRNLNLTRRVFLKNTAVLSIVPYIVPASALGRGGKIAPSERIVLGGIGVGGRGQYDMSAALNEADVQYVAACDVRKVNREQAKAAVDTRYANQDCAIYTDFRDLLARDDIDAVLIATGDRWHALASIMAMRAGKDVYCEKPACFTMAQGQKVVETARRYGRVYQTGAQRLSEPNHVFAIEMARSGRLGQIHTVYADIRWRDGFRHDWLPAQPEPARDEVDWDIWVGPSPWRPYNEGYVNGAGWYHFYDFATNVAMWGAHTIAQALAGLDMTDVHSIELEYAGQEKTMVTRLSNGVKLVLFRVDGSVWEPCKYWHGACGERFEGPEGWVAAADGYSKPDVSSPAMLREYKKVLTEYTGRTQRPMNHVRDFFDCIRSRRLTVANPEVMCRSMNICLAADICERLKRNLKFDLRKAEFVGDPEANRMRSRAMREPWII
jgi:predicted dehydrogenase